MFVSFCRHNNIFHIKLHFSVFIWCLLHLSVSNWYPSIHINLNIILLFCMQYIFFSFLFDIKYKLDVFFHYFFCCLRVPKEFPFSIIINKRIETKRISMLVIQSFFFLLRLDGWNAVLNFRTAVDSSEIGSGCCDFFFHSFILFSSTFIVYFIFHGGAFSTAKYYFFLRLFFAFFSSALHAIGIISLWTKRSLKWNVKNNKKGTNSDCLYLQWDHAVSLNVDDQLVVQYI